jgi:hypothetical protein
MFRYSRLALLVPLALLAAAQPSAAQSVLFTKDQFRDTKDELKEAQRELKAGDEAYQADPARYLVALLFGCARIQP